MTPASTIRKAPCGQVRLLAMDNMGGESVERDFWDEQEARGYIHEIADDRPWMSYYLYDDQGEEIDGRR